MRQELLSIRCIQTAIAQIYNEDRSEVHFSSLHMYAPPNHPCTPPSALNEQP